MTGAPPAEARYEPPPADGRAARYAVAASAPGAPRFAFHSRLEIGRDDGRPTVPGLLLLPDATISRSHCVVTQRPDGRCFVRDVSRNGTRLDGRRLVPNVETEWPVGHALTVGAHELVLAADEAAPAQGDGDEVSTVPLSNRTVVTVLAGDIRDYTVLVRTALSDELQRGVARVFESLSLSVAGLGGTVKEYQGDAILAFWEGDAAGRQVGMACRAAIALDALAARLAADRAVWPFDDRPLHLDWALATGVVLMHNFGAPGSPAGLSMMGEPVVRAFRIEKFASEETGRIVACSATRQLAPPGFAFRDLGERQAKGFDRPDRVYALLGLAP